MPGDSVELALSLSLAGCERWWHSTTAQPRRCKTHSGTMLHSIVHISTLQRIQIESHPPVAGKSAKHVRGDEIGAQLADDVFLLS